eukprot:8188403-Pyramimonas_sp.AAC.1
MCTECQAVWCLFGGAGGRAGRGVCKEGLLPRGRGVPLLGLLLPGRPALRRQAGLLPVRGLRRPQGEGGGHRAAALPKLHAHERQPLRHQVEGQPPAAEERDRGDGVDPRGAPAAAGAQHGGHADKLHRRRGQAGGGPAGGAPPRRLRALRQRCANCQ